MNHKHRLIFCTYSSLYSSLVLSRLLQSEQIEVVGIINSTRVLKPSFNSLTGALRLIQTTGLSYSTYLFLITDLFRLLKPLSRLKTIHHIAKEKAIPLLDTVDINADDEVTFIKQLAPEFLLSAHFNQLIKPPLLQRYTAINIHPSLLPNYKGVDPVFYALLANRSMLGVTTHLMDETFDTGKTLKQKCITTTSTDSVFSKNCQLFEAGTEIAIATICEAGDNKESSRLMKYKEHQAIGTEADKADYDSWPNSQLTKQLKKQGRSLILLKEFWLMLRSFK